MRKIKRRGEGKCEEAGGVGRKGAGSKKGKY